jgi:hypothetical protein
MTTETEHEGNVRNPFLNSIRVWENYLINWIEANRNFYENAIITNEQWLKAICYPRLKAENPERKETAKVE